MVPRAAPAGTHFARVLIVEDEFLIALQLEDILCEAGHGVIGVVCDHASLAGLRDAPHVAFVDINLRDGPSGPAIAHDLATVYGTAIFYVTANPDQIGEPAATALGVIAKPFAPATILKAMALAIGEAPDPANIAQGITSIQRDGGRPGL